MPAEIPPHWMVYFAVADCDATVNEAAALGGQVVKPPDDIPQGRFAIVADREGAAVGVVALSG
ncbi:MAG: VOC family protein [Acidimicrobiia bacterium]